MTFGSPTIFKDFDLQKLATENQIPPHFAFILRILRQAKLLSQIITYIWLYDGISDNPLQSNDEETERRIKYARELHKYFINPTEVEGKPGENLKKLLGAKPYKGNNDDLSPGALLYAVFGNRTQNNELFPMFDGFELGTKDPNIKGYLFTVDYNAFAGSIADPSKNNPELLKFTIPYPPSPKIANITVTLEELHQWTEDREYHKNFCSTNPYIPTTCS